MAHLGYFRDEFVQRRRWLDERGYADLVALCQFLPGPASSQVGLAIGLLRGGYRGSLAAWAGFTLPSAVALTLFALGIARWGDALPGGFIRGLKIVAVAVVAQAVWGMVRTLCSDGPRLAIMLAAASAVLLLPSSGAVAIIVVAGLIGLLAFRPTSGEVHPDLPVRIKMRTALSALAAFFALLILLPVLAGVSGSQALAQIDAFYRTGALVFGGGHVVLPLLQAEVVPSGWVDNDAFLAGYGAAQAVPTAVHLRGLLGASMNSGPRLARRNHLPARGVRALLPAGIRRIAVLGATARQSPQPGGAGGHQCRRGRVAAGGAVRPGLDQCDQGRGTLHPRRAGLRRAELLETATVVGGDRRCARRRPARPDELKPLSFPSPAAPHWPPENR